MEKWLILILVISIPLVSAKTIDIPEVFEVPVSGEKSSEAITGTTSYFYAGNRLIASKTNDEDIEYHYQDRLGSDINSKSLPFGQELRKGDRFSFTGKEKDKELHYFGARYYDSNLGRFTSVDPIKDEPPYQYVGNNPLRFVDPTGKGSVESEWRMFDVGLGAAFALGAGIWRGDSFGDIIKNTVIAAGASAFVFESKMILARSYDGNTGYSSENIKIGETLFARLLGDVSSSVAGNAIANRDPFSFIQLTTGPVNINIENGNIDADLDTGGSIGFLSSAIQSRGNLDIVASLASFSTVFMKEAEVITGGTNMAGSVLLRTDAKQRTFNHELVHTIQQSQIRNLFRGAHFGGKPSPDTTDFLGLGLKVPGDVTASYGWGIISLGADRLYRSDTGKSFFGDPETYWHSANWWERQARQIGGQYDRLY